MTKQLYLFVVLLVCATVTSCFAKQPVNSVGTKTISAQALKDVLNDPMLKIIDVRRASHWALSYDKIINAVRENPQDVGTWSANYDKSEPIVVYCA